MEKKVIEKMIEIDREGKGNLSPEEKLLVCVIHILADYKDGGATRKLLPLVVGINPKKLEEILEELVRVGIVFISHSEPDDYYQLDMSWYQSLNPPRFAGNRAHREIAALKSVGAV